MRIKTRLFISYLGMIFIPVILFALVGFLTRPYREDDYIIHGRNNDFVFPLTAPQKNFLLNLRDKILRNPNLLNDESFLREAAGWYDKNFSLRSRMPQNANPFIVSILIIILTNSLLTFLVSRSIIRPLANLQQAAERITEGDLAFPLIHASKDEFLPVYTAFEDMRQRLKASLEKQIQYERDRKELISSVSHDLRTPVTAIKGYIEGIKDGVADTPQKIKQYLDTIFAKTKIIDQLVDQLALFSSLDLNRVSFDFKELELIEFLKSIVKEAQTDYAAVSFTLSNLPEKQAFYLQADPLHLKRVFGNLIENAVKYNHKPEPVIDISLSTKGETVTICIKDNGPGINPELLPHIFERFFRADPSRSSNITGSGLGLAIAKQIILAHKGAIWAKSKTEAPSFTSLFIMLPLEAGDDTI